MPSSRRVGHGVLLVLAVLSIGWDPPKRTKDHDCRVDGALPDRACTPGAVQTTDLPTICGTRARTRRHVTEPERRQVFVAYGLSVPPPGDGGAYEVDHLIPLALGGSNDLANLWPEPRPEAEHKDRVEDLFHTLVCAGKMDLDEAQRIMATDWTAARR